MIHAIDHLVLTVRDIEKSVAFYEQVLGLAAVTFAGGRRALQVGDQKINLQTLGQETRNFAGIGSGDICLLTDLPANQVLDRLRSEQVRVLEGPVQKTGARGAITSVYFNDPDGNLIEVSSYSSSKA